MKYSLTDSIEIEGAWWLPDNPSDRYRGKMKYNPNGDSLLIIEGSFYPSLFSGSSKTIYGESLNGESITIYNSYLSSWSTGDRETTSNKFNSAYIGENYLDKSQDRIESMNLSFSYLESWFDFNPLHVNYPTNTKGKISMVEYTPPEGFFQTIGSLKAKIYIQSKSFPSLSVNDIRVQTYAFITIRPFTKQSFEWYEDVAYRLRQLLSVLIARPISLRYFYLCPKKRRYKHESKIRYMRVCGSYLFSQAGHVQSEDNNLHPREIPFTLEKLKPKLGTILNTWFSTDTRIDKVRDIVFTLSISEDSPIEFRFLSLIQALEAYDRTSGDNKYQSDEDYESVAQLLIDAIPSNLGEGHAAALKSRITYGNEYSLRKRLTALIRLLPTTLHSIYTKGDTNNFVTKVVDTRNYLVHRDETTEGQVLGTADIYVYTRYIELILTHFLLLEIGIPSDMVENELVSHDAYRHIEYLS